MATTDAGARAAAERGGAPSLVLVPTAAIVLVSAVLSAVLVLRQVRQLRAGLVDRAHTIAQFMVRDGTAAVASGDHRTLLHLASLAVTQEDVVYAGFLDAMDRPLAQRGETPPAAGTLELITQETSDGLLVYRTPVGWEFRVPLVGDAPERERLIGQIRLGLSRATYDAARQAAALTALAFTVTIAVLAIFAASMLMRRTVATLVARAALAEEQQRVTDLKTRIITQTSHEFRTPLAVIASACDVLQRYAERLSPEERRTRVEKIRGAVDQMTDLLDDVLMLGRTEAGRFTPAFTDLVALCEEAVRQVREWLPPDLQLATVLPSGTLVARVDPVLLGQAVRALLSNAVKFSPGGGTVTLELAVDEQAIAISVRDDGIGVPADDLPHLFEPFQRGGNVGKVPGAGLGLAIARRGVEAHEGTIRVTSTLGAGSTFVVSLPRARLAGGSVAA